MTNNRTKQIIQDVAELNEKVEKITATLQQLIKANNAVSMMMACVERHLDKTSPNWDEGVRESVARQSQDLEKRNQLITTLNEKHAEMTNDELSGLASDLWTVSERLGAAVEDFAKVVAIYLKAENLAGARRVLDHAAKIDGINQAVYDKLEQRFFELKGELDEA